MARSVMDQLLRFGEVRRGRIGVALQDLTAKQAAAQGLGAHGRRPDRAGRARIARRSRRPARRATSCVAVEGSPVRSSTELRNRIGLVETGSSVTAGHPARGPPQPAEGRPRGASSAADASIALPALVGATLDEIPPSHPAYGRIGGVLVTRVARDSAAARAGLRRGDLIIGRRRRSRSARWRSWAPRCRRRGIA